MAEETGSPKASIAVDVMGADLGPGEIITGLAWLLTA